ncbi:MAG: UvrD-helicase domain-containing protein [Deltaproteobacteria bacterium]|nr:UvrD-helicase domain-containing protein [Deltaproteobacteria bacterium]
MLTNLNPIQKEAVTFGDGPLLILAGAGSGKTRVLTARIAYLVREKGVAPGRILAVTFTNKAAGEIRRRLGRLIGDKANALWLGTFHSVGLRLLRKEARIAGISRDMTVYDDDNQLSLVKQVMNELNLNEKSFAPKAMLTRINQAKNENISATEFSSQASDFLFETTAKVYSLYQRRLREMNCFDFGDLICEPVRLLKENPNLLNRYRDEIQHVLVDEFQDTNRAQYEFTSLVASGARNLLVVGDPDQSIYAWRGADINNILDFNRDYPDATVVRLEQNYRSTGNILCAANSVIKYNQKRLEKNLWTENAHGDRLTLIECSDEYDEARAVISRIKTLRDEDKTLAYRDFAVFYRTNAQSRVFEETLLREGIPYAVIGGMRFYDRMEIKDAIAYLRVMSNPEDAVSLRRIINTPPRGMGPAAFEKIKSVKAESGVTLLDAVRETFARNLIGKSKAGEFIAACAAFIVNLGKTPLHELTLRLLEDSGYMLMRQDDGSEEAIERVENLFEFVSAIKDFESVNPGASLSDFLDHVALITDIDSHDESKDRLTLMTLHSAKGLEFNTVFLTGMEEGLFPHSRSSGNDEELEEERRVCYVGMTRAERRLFLSSAKTRSVYGETRYQLKSRFLEEIPGEFIETVEAQTAGFTTVGGRKEAASTAPGEPRYTTDDSQVFHYKEETYEANPASPWRVGMMVRHPSFGIGIIKDRSGAGVDTKLTINFKDAGMKKIIVKYAAIEAMG